jgi:hypothetical protein
MRNNLIEDDDNEYADDHYDDNDDVHDHLRLQSKKE